jgi:hypothetical protein
MANLLDQIFSGSSGQALGLLGAGLMAGNAPGGFQAATNVLAEAPRRDLQMQMLQEELSMKRLAEQRAQAMFKMQQDAYNGVGTDAPQSSQPAIPGNPYGGAMGSGTAGIPMPGQSAVMPQSNVAAQLNRLERQAYAGVPGAKEALDIFKYKNDPQKIDAGSYSRNAVTGELTYNPDPVKGVTYQGGQVSLLPGAAATQSAMTFASKLPETVATAAGTMTLRKGPDGREYPVNGLAENPVLQSLMDRYFPGAKIGGPAAAPTAPVAPAPTPMAGGARTVIDPAEQKVADAESIRMIQSELQNPNLPPDQKAGLQREIARLTVSQSQPGFPTPTLVATPQVGAPATSQGYGKTTAQETSDAATKAFLEGRAKGMNAYEDGLNGRVSQGGEMNMRLQEQLAALDKFKAGGGGETRAQLAQLAQGIPGMPASIVSGIAGGNLAAMQEFNKLAAQTAMEQLKQSMGGAGRISQYEFKVFQNNNPNLSTDPNAIRKIFDFNTRLYNRDLQEQQAFNQHVAAGADPASFPSKWAQQLASDGYTKLNMDAQNKSPSKQILRTGVLNGRKVIQYKDGTTSYAD